MNSTLSQPYTFLIFLYGGIATGLLYDACAVLRFLLQKLRAGVAADLLFALGLLVALLITFFYATSGIPRLYGFGTMLLGFYIERATISRLLPHKLREM